MSEPLTNTDLDTWLQGFANEMPDVVHTTRRLLAALGDTCELPPVASIEDNGTILLQWNVRGVYVNAEVGTALVEWCAIHLPTDAAVGEEGVLVPEAARDMRPWLKKLFDAYREQGPQQGSDVTHHAPFPVWLLEQSIRTSWPRRREPKKRAQIRELARALRVLKRSAEFITEASARALLAQQRWTLVQKRADENAEFWQSPRGTDTVLFPLRPDFIDYQRCLVAVVRDVYEDAREARRRRST